MKNLILILISTSLIWACGPQEETTPDLINAPTNGWDTNPAGEFHFTELTNTSGALYFTDAVNHTFTLLDGKFVCADDYPEIAFQAIEIVDQEEYTGVITDIQDQSIFLNEGIVYYDSEESEATSGFEPVPPDCQLFLNERERPCIDGEGREGSQYCFTMVLVCFSNAFGLQIDPSPEQCFPCGGFINGLDEEPEEFDTICF